MAIFNSSKNNPATFTPGNLNIINAGTTIIGDLNSEGDMRVDGTIKGQVSSKARLVMGPTSRVEGDIKAANVEISGEVNGNIYVSELLTVKASAKISGDLISSKLIIEAGAEFNGKCSMKEARNVMKKISSDEQPAAKDYEPKATRQVVQ
jgi:cytoskeletal protein CcmA (bactofilin family)